jgi:hypothetical protein
MTFYKLEIINIEEWILLFCKLIVY